MDFGLIGKSLSHSFSRHWFMEKFQREKLPHHYHNFELDEISDLRIIIGKYPALRGLNVTIPYKEAVIPLLHQVDDVAGQVGAVNTIDIKNGKLQGYNTDVYGFEKSLLPLLKDSDKRALILGTGGASRAISHVLDKLKIDHRFVSRKPGNENLHYDDLQRELPHFQIVINTTPLGTSPAIDESPPLPFHLVDENHLFYDLIYNPAQSHFLREAQMKRARIKNGLEMLHLQAEKAWYIWNS